MSRHVSIGIATFPANGAWQPTTPESQHADNTVGVYVYVSAHVVDVWPCDEWRDRGELPVTHSGLWPDDDLGRLGAKRFAASAGSSRSAVVRKVAPYRYAPAWGRISDTMPLAKVLP